jgi:hypothetical protein
MVYHNPSMFLDLDTVDYPGLTCSALLVLDSDFRCRFPSFMSLMEDNGMEEIQQLLTMPETEANLSECLGGKLLIQLLSIVVVLFNSSCLLELLNIFLLQVYLAMILIW